MTFEVVDLHRSYGSRAILRGVNFILNQGELVCLMGENGAGKTTFIDTVLSRVAPVRGEIRFHDQVLSTTEERLHFISRTAVLGHDAGVFPDLSAEENLRFFERAYHGSLTGEGKERISELLSRAGLYSRRHDFVRTFSRGMRQKIGICRAVLHFPELVFLDEPITALDSAGVDFFFEILSDIRRTAGVFVVTHDPSVFRGQADGFVLLAQGAFSPRAKSDLNLKAYQRT